MLAYLSGSIEYSTRSRQDLAGRTDPFLRSLGHEVYDPAEDEKKNLTEIERREFRGVEALRPASAFSETIRKIIAYDLDWIEQRTDYIVAYLGRVRLARRGLASGVDAGPSSRYSGLSRDRLPLGAMLAAGFWVALREVFSSFDQLKAIPMTGKRYPQANVKSLRPQRRSRRVFHELGKGNLGWIEVVCGPMFSGKSEELIRRLRRAEIARQRVQIFKPGNRRPLFLRPHRFAQRS